MKLGDPEVGFVPSNETVVGKMRLVIGNIGDLVLSHLTSISAEFKLSTGLDATSPFSPREIEYLNKTGQLGRRALSPRE